MAASGTVRARRVTQIGAEVSGRLVEILVDVGDEVVFFEPFYDSYRASVAMAGAVERLVTLEAPGFGYDPAALERAFSPKTRAILVNTPHNPTGKVFSRAELERIAELCALHGVIGITDEIYEHILFDGETHSSIWALPGMEESTVLVSGHSKGFAMTGWRLGWLVVPEAWVPVMERLAQNLYLSAPTIAQYAALAAMQPATVAILEERRADFHERRDFLYPALEQLGFGMAGKPQGAFYLYADCSGLTGDSFAFCERMLEEAGVAITPGKDFGFNEPQRYVRFAYTTSVERMQLAIERLGQAIR